MRTLHRSISVIPLNDCIIFTRRDVNPMVAVKCDSYYRTFHIHILKDFLMNRLFEIWT